MKKIKISFHLPDLRDITIIGDLQKLPLGVLALAAVLCIGTAAKGALADQKQPKAPSTGEGQISYVDDAEDNAYRAARKEPDPKKRAAMLMEFLQKYPKSMLMEQADYEEIKTVEDEYNAYYAAGKETDFAKRAAMFVEFVQKYPESTLMEQINNGYMEMLKETSQGKKYELLESLAEKWLKIHPKEKEAYAFVAEAAMNLKKYDKCGECLEAIYGIQPFPSLAREIHMCYQKADNLAKQIEWADKLFKMPEFDGDYMLRYDCVMSFYKENNLPKAAEYAQLALKSADLAERPDAAAQEQLRKVRRACYHVIASNLMEKGNYAEAASAFKNAVEAEKYGDGYYKIGLCLDNQKEIEDAIVYYAAAEIMGGEDAPKAKARLEVLYKAIHNDTLIGIDKVYKRAKELTGGAK